MFPLVLYQCTERLCDAVFSDLRCAETEWNVNNEI